MAKRKRKQSGGHPIPDPKQNRIVKLWLNDQQIADLRVAAGICDTAVSTLAREGALARAAEVIKKRYPEK